MGATRAGHVRAYRLPACCWELDRRPDDEYVPHFTTKEQAVTQAAEWVADDQPIPVIIALPTPCWVTVCTGCGADTEHREYGPNLHYPTAESVDADTDDLTCDHGCPADREETPGSVAHLQDPSLLMDPLPGLETYGDPAGGDAGYRDGGRDEPAGVA